MLNWNGLQIASAIICGSIAFVVGLPALCAFVLAGRLSREEERTPLYQHVCSSCGRKQWSITKFDDGVCRACELVAGTLHEINLDDFADATAIRVYLDSVELRQSNGQPQVTASSPAAHSEAG